MTKPLVTVAVPSLNHGRFLDKALRSVFLQDLPLEVVVLDGGSGDSSISIIKKWEDRLLWWRSEPDGGQAGAINEGVARGGAPYVCWLNADDYFLPEGLKRLTDALKAVPDCPAVYGRCWTVDRKGKRLFPYITAPFRSWLLANYCFIAQPATLIRRSAWEEIGGLDEGLNMALDYDLWWRLYLRRGDLTYVREFVAATRMHAETKTALKRKAHYRESMDVVFRHTGTIPLKWRVSRPFMVSFREAVRRIRGSTVLAGRQNRTK